MSPFVFPKDKHVRTKTPVRQYKRYNTYKKYLREEFSRKCIYCCACDSMRGTAAFAVEHYLPKTDFPNLTTDYLNLFYCCNTCNSFKGDWYPSPADLKDGRFIPNPCDHVMFSHLRFKGPRIDSMSVAGQYTLRLLDLNEDEAVKYREFVLDNIELWGRKVAELEGVVPKLNTLLAAGRLSAAEHAALVNETNLNFDKARVHLARFLGS